MIITRWQAPLVPRKEVVVDILTSEGFEPYEETFEANVKIQDHRHPFSEIRVVVSGELLCNISGNQVLLRPGDRIEIPSNTRHSHVTNGPQICICICCNKIG